jgi:hypothetical protein
VAGASIPATGPNAPHPISMPKKDTTRPHRRATGIDKAHLKRRIRDLKARRDQAIERREGGELPAIHHELHALRHQLRKHAELVR